LLVLLLSVRESSPAHAAWITSFQDAFQLTTPAPGWSYLWNDAGPIGDPANYAPLIANTIGAYTTDGSDVVPSPAPAHFLAIRLAAGAPGGHPGMGALQSGSGGIERYCIAAYTLPSSEKISILDGLVRNVNPNSNGSTDGVSVKIFLNNNPLPVVNTGTAAGFDSSAAFNVALGDLNAGDTIYVAVGSKDSDLFDGFQLRYDIVAVPEPLSVALAMLGLPFLIWMRHFRNE
jgi:hypothetical protein